MGDKSEQNEPTKVTSDGVVERVNMTPEEWEARWTRGSIGFHKSFVHPSLINSIDKMIKGRSNIRFFVPLCGKTLDMKWIGDLGHRVVGVEVATQAIEEFFTEHKMEYSKVSAPDVEGTLYKSDDDKYHLYACDIYKFSRAVEGKFDAIWDRGSLVAICRRDREKYSSLILDLISSDGCLLLSTFDYDAHKYPGPPNSVSEEEIADLFGSKCDIVKVEDNDSLGETQKEWGLDWMRQRAHLITPKA